MKLPALLSTALTAEYVGVSLRHIRRVADEVGAKPVVMFHGRMYWRKADVQAMKRHRVKRRA